MLIGGKVPESMVSVKLILQHRDVFFFFRFILDVAWH